MRDILFGMAVGGILGILLYKKNDCAKEMFDKGEDFVMDEIEKVEKATKDMAKNSSKK
ncbi:MAG: hypothetical protein PHX09_00185 [Clostridia bacterium]|nr:hypothetical protein [Clostridia bacterium]MDD4685667.1 hypothetical protein [Clostridia bacterium]